MTEKTTMTYNQDMFPGMFLEQIIYKRQSSVLDSQFCFHPQFQLPPFLAPFSNAFSFRRTFCQSAGGFAQAVVLVYLADAKPGGNDFTGLTGTGKLAGIHDVPMFAGE